MKTILQKFIYSIGLLLSLASPVMGASDNSQNVSIDTTVKVTADLYKRIYVNSIAQILAQRPLITTEKYCFINTYNSDEIFLKPVLRKSYTVKELQILEKFFNSALGKRFSHYMMDAAMDNATIRPFSPLEEKQIKQFFNSEIGLKFRANINNQLRQIAESEYMTRIILCNIPIKPPKT